MRKLEFETPQLDELIGLANAEHRLALEDLRVPQVEDHPVSEVLPYRVHMMTYEWHLGHCPVCQDAPVWDTGCDTGSRMAHVAADVMAQQDEMAACN